MLLNCSPKVSHISAGMNFPTSPAFSISVFKEKCVYFVIFMSICTVGLFGINRSWAFASNCIFFHCDCFKMIGIYANSISAKVIYYKAIWDCTLKNFIKKSMGLEVNSKKSNYTIATLFRCHCPVPATRFSFFNTSHHGFGYIFHSFTFIPKILVTQVEL